VGQADGLAAVSGAKLQLTDDPAEAVDGAHAVYTDVWTSMGQEKEAAKRRKAFAAYQVNDALFALAQPDAVFMHCLPAHREEEVADSVIEHSRSVVFDQAENRLHAQKALLLMMMA
jgi:ornithine carbamoyltransferase